MIRFTCAFCSVSLDDLALWWIFWPYISIPSRVHLREPGWSVHVVSVQQWRNVSPRHSWRLRVQMLGRIRRRALRTAGGRLRLSTVSAGWSLLCQAQRWLLLWVPGRSGGPPMREQHGRLHWQELSGRTCVRWLSERSRVPVSGGVHWAQLHRWHGLLCQPQMRGWLHLPRRYIQLHMYLPAWLWGAFLRRQCGRVQTWAKHLQPWHMHRQ